MYILLVYRKKKAIRMRNDNLMTEERGYFSVCSSPIQQNWATNYQGRSKDQHQRFKVGSGHN